METLIELINRIVKAFHLNESVGNQIIIIVLITGVISTIITFLIQFFRIVVRYRYKRYLNKKLGPYFSPADVSYATRFYIPTKCQNISPSEDEEPSKWFIVNTREKLMPIILKRIFPSESEHNKHYLILADTGMGKTTFLINLYLKYKSVIRFPWQLPLPSIYLFPLGAPGILEKIRQIENKNESVILLDAFDEDIDAIKNYAIRLKEILTVVNDFSKIIITCRTQFFPSRIEEPHGTGIMTFAESGQYYFQKLYL